MKELRSSEVIVEWGTLHQRYYPTALDVGCPYCRMVTNFSTSEPAFDAHRATIAVTARCARCRNTVYLWLVSPSGDGARPHPALLLMHPSPAEEHRPIERIDLLPEPLQRAYRDTVIGYNTGLWSATATLCRRTLEGIVNDLNPGQGGPLFGRLEKLGDSVDLAKPLITLSHAIRQVGNLGAHFDLRKEPDRDTVKAQLELIEYLLEYVYTLPGMIETVNQKVDALGAEVEESAEEAEES